MHDDGISGWIIGMLSPLNLLQVKNVSDIKKWVDDHSKNKYHPWYITTRMLCEEYDIDMIIHNENVSFR